MTLLLLLVWLFHRALLRHRRPAALIVGLFHMALSLLLVWLFHGALLRHRRPAARADTQRCREVRVVPRQSRPYFPACVVVREGGHDVVDLRYIIGFRA